DADVIGPGMVRLPEAKQRVQKIPEPADKQHAHQGMNINNQVVHVLAVFGGQDGQGENAVLKPVSECVCHRSKSVWRKFPASPAASDWWRQSPQPVWRDK